MDTENKAEPEVKPVKFGLAFNECRRQVKYEFTRDERIEKAIALGNALDRKDATENELARIKKDYGAQVDIIQAEIDSLNLCVRTGNEMREYVCGWTYDDPSRGRKTLRKREGGEVVAVEDMTEEDRQIVIDLNEGFTSDAEATAAAERGERFTASLAKAKAEAERKADKTRRRASGAGTVEVSADEGSRDDAGTEGKNDI